jgi:hypothetical protein
MNSPLKNLILIHGMNNSLKAMGPLQRELELMGFNTHLLELPGHGEDRRENYDVESAMKHFDQRLRTVSQTPYGVVAFSQGALYLQGWISQYPHLAPRAQVLLAPALFLRHEGAVRLLATLPMSFRVMSFTPLNLRRFHFLYAWEYRTIKKMVDKFQGEPKLLDNTLILIDHKDELIDDKKLKENFTEKVIVIKRPYLRGRWPGKYHVLFHPDYFTPEDWRKILNQIQNFFSRF